MSITAVAAPGAPEPLFPQRSEAAGIAGLLALQVDGRTVEIPVLKTSRSRLWQKALGEVMAGISVPTSFDASTGADIVGQLAQLGTESMVRMVAAYDTLLACPPSCDRRGEPPGPGHSHVGPLGGIEGIEDRMTVAEVYAAVRTMGSAEFPLLRDVRSVVEAFGPQIQAYVPIVMATVGQALQRASSTSGPSPTGDSTPTASEIDSPTSSSSSAGPTAGDG